MKNQVGTKAKTLSGVQSSKGRVEVAMEKARADVNDILSQLGSEGQGTEIVMRRSLEGLNPSGIDAYHRELVGALGTREHSDCMFGYRVSSIRLGAKNAIDQLGVLDANTSARFTKLDEAPITDSNVLELRFTSAAGPTSPSDRLVNKDEYISNSKQSHPVDLRGQTAWVTGAGRGLGRAFAVALAEAGASVAISARSFDQVKETVELIEKAGGRVLALPCDVTDEKAIDRVGSAIEAILGKVDLLVNNAGVMAPSGKDWQVNPDEWWRTLEINVRGPFLVARRIVPSMIERGKGRIVNISSGVINSPLPNGSAYGTSKTALTHLTECLAHGVREYGISVFAYDPGYVHTAMTTYLADSPEIRSWAGTLFRDIFDAGKDTPIELPVQDLLFLASGRADALTGRVVRWSDNNEELVSKADEIAAAEGRTLRLRE